MIQVDKLPVLDQGLKLKFLVDRLFLRHGLSLLVCRYRIIFYLKINYSGHLGLVLCSVDEHSLVVHRITSSRAAIDLKKKNWRAQQDDWEITEGA